MSELSLKLFEIYKSVPSIDVDEVPSREALEEILPNLPAWHRFSYATNIRNARILARYFGGRVFENQHEAYEETKDKALEIFTPSMVMALGAGVQFGRQPSKLIKKYRVLGQIDEIFDAPTFQADLALDTAQYFLDEDAYEGMKKFLQNAFIMMASHSGWGVSGAAVHLVMAQNGQAGEEKEMDPYKVMDVWFMTMMSVMLTLYQVGIRLGRDETQNEILAGIAAASKDGDE